MGEQLETGVRGDLEWGSIPALARSAAERFGDSRRGGRRRRPPVLRRAGRRRPTRAARAFVAAGLEPGDRVAIWSPNIHEWIVALLGLQSAGGVARADQHPLQGRRGGLHPRTRAGPRALVTVNGFLGNDYVAMLEGHDLPHLEHRIVLRGDVPDGAVSWDDVPGRGRRRARGRGRRARGRAHGRRRVRHPLHVGHHREPEGRGVHPRPDAARLRRLGRHRRPARATTATSSSTRSSTPSATRPASSPASRSGATLVPQAVFDIPEADGQRRRAPASPRCPGRRRSTRRSSTTPTSTASQLPVAAPRGHRRRAGARSSCSSGWSTSSASRPWSPPTGSPRPAASSTVCRPDDPPETHLGQLGPRHPRRRGARRRRRRRARCRAASRARSSCGATTSCGATSRTPSRPPRPSTPTAGCTPATSGRWTTDGYVAITDRKKDMFIVGGFNAYPAEIENLLLAHPDIAQVAVVGVPDERMGEVGVAFVVPDRRHDARPGRGAWPGPGSTWPTTRCPGTSPRRRAAR